MSTNSNLFSLSIRPVIWSISGSDCSGGAGIQADLKTAHTLHCELCSLITANTTQNSKTLVAVNPTDIEVLQQQYQTLLDDKPPAVIKIGLLANDAQVVWLSQVLKQVKQQLVNCLVVFDPVMRASVGKSLTADTINPQSLLNLLPLIDVITPNRPEAELITELCTEVVADKSNSDKKTELQLAEDITALGVKNVIITGGHNPSSSEDNSIIDLCLSNDQINKAMRLESKKVDTDYSHGSGCSFASAMASWLAHGYLVRDAFMHSKAFMNAAFALSSQQQELQKNNDYGALIQPSWPVEKRFYPKVVMHHIAIDKTHNGFASCETQQLGLYPVIDSLEWLQTLLPLELEIIQLRVKNKTPEELEQIIQQAVEIAKPFKTRLFINDHWQLAIKHGAYGIHLGQEDIDSADLIAIQKSGLRLGISTHGIYEFRLAEQLKPSYLAIGAIFPTVTKDMTGQIQGVANLTQILQAQNSDIPVVAIGGINLERAANVLKSGVKSIAVVTAITRAEDSIAAVKTWQQLF